MPPQRIGLSATQRPLEAIAEFLGGGEPTATGWEPRPVTIVDAPWDKELDLEIVVPVADMTRPEETPVAGAVRRRQAAARSGRPMYPRLLELVLDQSLDVAVRQQPRPGRATRRRAQPPRRRGAGPVPPRLGVPRAASRDREPAEGGDLRGVVATSTLELGIDMAAIDLVVLVESPTSVARGLQRVGRAGHQVGAPSVARIFPKHRGDLLETAVVVDRMTQGAIEATRIPPNPLDVLAQQIVAMVAVETASGRRPLRPGPPGRAVSRTSPDRASRRSSTCSPVATRPTSSPSCDPGSCGTGSTGPSRHGSNAKLLAVTNAGTIPDRGLYTVIPARGRQGRRARRGDGLREPARRRLRPRLDLVEDQRDHPRPGHRDPGARARRRRKHAVLARRRSRPSARARQGRRCLRPQDRRPRPRRGARTSCRSDYRLDPWAADNLAAFIDEERDATGALPTDRTIVVERFRDEIGDWRMVRALPVRRQGPRPVGAGRPPRYREQRRAARSTSSGPTTASSSDSPTSTSRPGVDLILDPEEVEELVLEEVADTALFTSRFREAAARALLLPRRRPGSRTPLWLQRRKAASLLDVAKRFAVVPHRARDVPRGPPGPLRPPCARRGARPTSAAARSGSPRSSSADRAPSPRR